MVIMVLMAVVAGAYGDCSHVLINSQCWLKKCPDETSLQCGSIAVNVTKPVKFAAVQCGLTHRELPSSYIEKKVRPGVYAVSLTTPCDGICQLLKG
jgi:hypothetical protein